MPRGMIVYVVSVEWHDDYGISPQFLYIAATGETGMSLAERDASLRVSKMFQWKGGWDEHRDNSTGYRSWSRSFTRNFGHRVVDGVYFVDEREVQESAS